MKKFILKGFAAIALMVCTLTVNAQGTWIATGTETAIDPATAIEMSIPGLSVMHSDAATVIGKTDDLAPSVIYNNVTWENKAYIQGSTNAMYYAFLPTSNGTLDISVKMGSGKVTFALELTSSCPNSADLATLTGNIGTVDGILANSEYFTAPTVFDTYNGTSNTWDGTVAIQTSGSNQYLVMSFPVTANKIYTVGCKGSKLMLRGVNYATSGTSIQNLDELEGVSVYSTESNILVNLKEFAGAQIEVMGMDGRLISKKAAVSNVENIDTKAMAKGIYVVKVSQNGKFKTKKIAVQ